MDVEIISPLPRSWWPNVWAWLQDDRALSFDDYGPETEAEFENQLEVRLQREWLWGVTADGESVGAIGVAPVSDRMASLHGIVFKESARGKGIAAVAVKKVLDALWLTGMEKIVATYFSDNMRVHGFLKHLGAVEEGYLKAHSVRQGMPIDMRLVAWFRED